MRGLTFAGFLRRYVKELSFCGSTNVYKLLKEAQENNPRLYEPLFLYCYFWNKKDLLEGCTVKCEEWLIEEVLQLFCRYPTTQDIVKALQNDTNELSENYRKVWRSYQAARDRVDADDHTKELMRSYIKELQDKHKVSTYRIYRDLNLNPGNFNAWLKHGTPNKISLTSARRVINYLEGASN